MKLVIVESPTKAKTLSGILPKEYIIKASMGHVRDLPKSGLGVDVEHNFEPTYIVPEKAKKNLDDLKKVAKDADTILLATDPDREGEAISWHLYEELKGKKSKGKSKKAKAAEGNEPTKEVTFSRVVFHELTKDAIEHAFSQLGEINIDLVNAQQARRVLDRLVGYKLSPLLWKKVRYGLSAGRVQSVAVRLIVERERERKAFKADEYWDMAVSFTDKKGKRPLSTELFEKDGAKLVISNEAEAKNHEESLKASSFNIEAVKRSERKKNPYPPYKTSTLQQGMANVYGFTAKRTMDVAQKLFEKGFITYHRTDSFNLAEDFVKKARDYIKEEYGSKFLPETPNVYKTKSANAQEAHEAIRPTLLTRSPDKKHALTTDEHKVYTMIWKRALECQMEQAIYDQTSIIVASNNGYKLRASGSIVKFDGWMLVGKKLSILEEEDEVAKSLPVYEDGEPLQLNEITPSQHFTQPPARYTDASLVKKLEELEVGRPSTYAPTISTIQNRGYVIREGRAFIPTDVAYVVIDLLVQNFPNIVDYGFTADIEKKLDDVAEGTIEWVPIIRDFYVPFEKDLEEKEKILSKSEITNLGESDEICPKCGKKLIIKLGKYGKFLSCSDYPTCDYAKPMDEAGTEGEGTQEDYGTCDKCNEGKMILKRGRFGKFLACNNYPKCKNTKPFLVKIGFACPKCVTGEVVVKKAKRKIFYGCSRYPECDWSSWTNPKPQEAVEASAPEA